MITPNLILFLLLTVYPVLWCFRYIFYQYGGLASREAIFIGLDNFTRLFTNDPIFPLAVKNTFVYAAGKVGLVIPLAFFSAMMLNRKTVKASDSCAPRCSCRRS